MLSRQRSRELRRAIRAVLLETWDPIGIRDEPNAQDEYEDYEGAILRLLTQGNSDADIAAYLCWVESDQMGLSSANANRLRPVIDALRTLDVGGEPGGAPS